MGNFYGDVDRKEAINTIQQCIKSGINYLDTSPWYGASEEVIGEALREVPREAFYIGTKVGRFYTPTWDGRFDFSAARVLQSVEKSLELLGLNYVDIIQVHDIEFCLDPKIIIEETIPALESVVKAGKAKFIGITGYNLEVLKEMSTKFHVDTILSYARFNFHDTSLNDYVPHFAANNVGIINASPVAMGLFTTAGPPKWHAASPDVKIAARKASSVAQTLGTTLENASLGFSLRPTDKNIATTLVSIPTQKILEENLQLVTTPINSNDTKIYDEIQGIFKNIHGPWEGIELEEYRNSIKK